MEKQKDSPKPIGETPFQCERSGYALIYAACINRQGNGYHKCKGCSKGKAIQNEMRKER